MARRAASMLAREIIFFGARVLEKSC